ncbi:hypothetical protein ACIQZO_04455 [Streptomyces sp. NPDC097617]|uniref:hypothetical protein n=1 Tax=Streptomyces sp. NPDC097617 TaxID=3366091 RepID=UPI003803637B
MTTPQLIPHSHQPVPYEETTDPRYAQDVVANHDVAHVKGKDYTLTCVCPRCGAALAVPLFEPDYRALLGARRSAAQPAAAPAPSPAPTSAATANPPFPISCDCPGTHDGRPEDRTGCGAFWTLTLS